MSARSQADVSVDRGVVRRSVLWTRKRVENAYFGAAGAGEVRHAQKARTYGITTLTKRHVSAVDSEVRFIFRGKNSKLVRRSVRSEPLARGVSELLELPGGGRLTRMIAIAVLFP